MVKMQRNQRASSFDHIAFLYRFLEGMAFGPLLQRARVIHLEQIASAKEILLAGEGNGRFLEALLSVNPHCRVTCIDKSRAMLDLARNRIRKSDEKRVCFKNIDLTSACLPSVRYDAIVTHFFLDCFSCPTLKLLLPKLAACLNQNGMWLLADFIDPSKQGMLGLFQRSAMRFMYAFFKSTCSIEAHELCDPKDMLLSLGMQETKRQTYLKGWIISLVYEKTFVKKPARAALGSFTINNQKALTHVD